MHRKGLLLGALAHLLEFEQRVLPFLIVLNKGIVFERIINSLYIYFRHLVRWKAIFVYLPYRESEKAPAQEGPTRALHTMISEKQVQKLKASKEGLSIRSGP